MKITGGKMKHDVRPGSGERDAPDAIVPCQDGGKMELRFRRKNARKPRHYHLRVPDKSRPGWVVYITYLPLIVLVIAIVKILSGGI